MPCPLNRLHLPNEVVENGKESATYDADKQAFSINLPKLNVGQHFEGLEMLTKLLTAPKTAKCTPGIEVIGDDTVVDDDDSDQFDWHIEQRVRTEVDDKALLGEKYGFANRYEGVFNRLQDEVSLLIDLPEPDSKSQDSRRSERIAAERACFDDDHYLSDLYEQREELAAILNYKARWEADEKCELDDEDRFRMKNLPKREYLLEKHEKMRLLLGVVDILFAYAYDVRTTEGEHSVESSWTICKLSATLSWLDSFESLKETTIASLRRSLCFPLYRSWRLSNKVLIDVQSIIAQGRASVLKCFLDVHRLFNESGDSRYVLNDLYITDYCVWLQRVKEETFAQLASALAALAITKLDVDLDLPLLERAAQLALEEQSPHSNGSSEAVGKVCAQLDDLAV